MYCLPAPSAMLAGMADGPGCGWVKALGGFCRRVTTQKWGQLLFFVVLAGLSVVSIAPIALTSFPTYPSYTDEGDLLQSMEYQIALNPKSEWANREEMLARWITFINSKSQFVHLRREDAEEDVFDQYQISPGGGRYCSLTYALVRVRHFHDRDRTQISIKGADGVSPSQSCIFPFWPAKQYMKSAEQKCEEDYHPCFDKFTRASTISLPGIIDPVTCKEMAILFPGAFSDLKPKNYDFIPPRQQPCTWWRVKWKGKAGTRSLYDVTFALRYCTTPEEAQVGGPIINGEWSMRTHVAKGELWERDVVRDLRDLFYRLVLEFDTYVEHKSCAQAHFEGKRVPRVAGFPLAFD